MDTAAIHSAEKPAACPRLASLDTFCGSIGDAKPVENAVICMHCLRPPSACVCVIANGWPINIASVHSTGLVVSNGCQATLATNICAPVRVALPTEAKAISPESSSNTSPLNVREEKSTEEEDDLACSSNATLFYMSQFVKACMNNEEALARYYYKKLEYRHVVAALKRNDWQILYEAASKGYTGIVKLISEIDSGTDVMVGTPQRSPLIVAWLNGHRDTANMICTERNLVYDDVHEILSDAFISVCERGYTKIAKDIVERFDVRTADGFYTACAYGHKTLAAYLSAEERPKIHEAIDALHAAVAGNHYEVACWIEQELMLTSYTPLNLRQHWGLHDACKKGHSAVVMWAVETYKLDDEGFDGVLTDLAKHPGLAMWLMEKIPSLKGKINCTIA